jgi:hypothetical protein
VKIFLNAKYVVRKFAQDVQTMKKFALIFVSQIRLEMISIKNSVKEEIINKFTRDILEITVEERKNKREINRIAERQRVIKKTKYEINKLLNQVKGYQ